MDDYLTKAFALDSASDGCQSIAVLIDASGNPLTLRSVCDSIFDATRR
jgi:hypothetical protein